MAKDKSRQVADLDAAPSQENPDFVPDPTHVYGTLDTSGTAGGNHEKLELISPIFDVAKAQDIALAARAVDPDDEEIDENTHVVLPDNGRDADSGRDAIRRAADRLGDVPVQDPSLTLADQANAAKDSQDEGATQSDVEAQQRATSPLG